MYDNCLLLSPTGRVTDEIKNIRCNAYYNEAVKLSRSQNVEDLRKANGYFDIAKKNCPTGKNIDSQIQRNENQIRRATRR